MHVGGKCGKLTDGNQGGELDGRTLPEMGEILRILSKMSFMNTNNTRGQKTDPWDTLALTVLNCYATLLKNTHCILFER